jgi:hypothetical protein
MRIISAAIQLTGSPKPDETDQFVHLHSVSKSRRIVSAVLTIICEPNRERWHRGVLFSGYACFERDTLLLEWSIGTIRIRGPKVEVFFDKFANHQATSISADGKDIESVTMRLKTDEAVEEAFAAIERITDADLNIEDESDERG